MSEAELQEISREEVDAEVARLSLYQVSQRLVELMTYRDQVELAPEEREAVDQEIARYVAHEITKVDNIRGYLRHCEVMVEAHRSEAERQTRMAQGWEERSKRLKNFCIKALEASNRTRVEGKTGVLKIQKNGGVQPMEIFDDKRLPTEYTPMVISFPVDNEKLRQDLAAGKEVPGARLLARGKHLRVE